MGFNQQFQLMAVYNQRLNGQVYQAASQLTAEALAEDRGAFFGSIMGTLNHLLVGDLLWLSRFTTHADRFTTLNIIDQFPKPQSLDQVLFTDFAALNIVRSELDVIIIEWLDQTDDADFDRPFTYKNSQGIESTRNFAAVVTHLFNHQTHHRGQVTTLLSQLGCDVGTTDFLMDIPQITIAPV